jgi:dCMP deaminase
MSTDYQRPSWDDYFLEVAHAIAKRATCDRGRSGCVIARNKQLLVTGYVGAPAGLPHCDEAGHQMKKVVHEDGRETCHCVRTVHAEQNAIVQAATYGIRIKDASLFCTNLPCSICIKMIINADIRTIFYEEGYPDSLSEELIKEADITLTKVQKHVK